MMLEFSIGVQAGGRELCGLKMCFPAQGPSSSLVSPNSQRTPKVCDGSHRFFKPCAVLASAVRHVSFLVWVKDLEFHGCRKYPDCSPSFEEAVRRDP